MQITDIINYSLKPSLYEKGTSFMWTDEYISKQLLNIHLQEDLDLGSRQKSSIIKTVDWILGKHASVSPLDILDLGCGPGLYAEKFAKAGHRVHGIDISRSSIDYARRSAGKNRLSIDYTVGSYLEHELETGKYDLILLIYTDFGVLLPDERDTLLKQVYKALKPGGIFIFDVLKGIEIEKKIVPGSWEAVTGGFWKKEAYLALSNSFLYEEEKVILMQHIIADNMSNCEVYRFWTHLFSENDIETLLLEFQFQNIHFRDDLLPDKDTWSGRNVLFCTAIK